MDEFIKTQLEQIAHASQLINNRITAIMGYCAGQESGVEQYYTPLPLSPTFGNGYQKIISPNDIIQEIKEMIIELKIKGSVRERPNGLIELRTQALGSIYGRTKEEVELKLTQRLKEARRKCKDKSNTTKTPLLSEFFNTEYLPYKINQARSESSIKSYKREIKFIVEEKFNKPLHLYKPKDIEDFLFSIPKTRKRQIIQGLLNNIFNRALMLSLIKANPCVPLEKMRHSQSRGSAFSFDEQLEFFETLIKSNELSYNDKSYFIFVYLVGTRRTEALAVAVDDVDFKNKVLHIPGTKTEGSNRQVPLTPLVEKLLRSLNVDQGKYFTITEANANKYFRKVWEKEKGHKLHDLRHTFGTIQICVKKNDIKTVSLWLGHSTIDTTLQIYTHPENLDSGTFLSGNLTEAQKNEIYMGKYNKILNIIENFI